MPRILRVLILLLNLIMTGACQSAPTAPTLPAAALPATKAAVAETRLSPTVAATPTESQTSPTAAATDTPPPAPAPTVTITGTEGDSPMLSEAEVLVLPLGAPLNEGEAEISGMAWDGERLVLLPQFPNRYDGQLFSIGRAEILAQITNEAPETLQPTSITFDDGGLSRAIDGFEGFEAIAFQGSRFYVTIEARRTATTMTGYLVAGEVSADGSMALHAATLTELPAPVALENYSDEAIIIAGDTVLTFYEANGANVNPDAVAHHFDSATLAPLTPLPLAPLEYRLTDATPIDGNNRFWVINYLFPGDLPKLRPAPDSLRAMHGEGESHAHDLSVERLVEMEITDDGIAPTDSAPLYLRLNRGTPRNWEGIARVEGEGFLLVSDKFPTTLLAFVRYEEMIEP